MLIENKNKTVDVIYPDTNGKRIYPKHIFEIELKKYKIKICDRKTYGEINHE